MNCSLELKTVLDSAVHKLDHVTMAQDFRHNARNQEKSHLLSLPKLDKVPAYEDRKPETPSEIALCWENLTIRAKATKKTGSSEEKGKVILQKASGCIQSGELCAIMGASGAGKSSLLNALTFRNMKGLEIVSGGQFINGVPASAKILKAISGYVQQEDLFIGTLTVRETLEFHSKVRMDADFSQEQKLKRVNSVIHELGLTKCQNTIIGEPGRIKGISGGERKRLALACEVLTNPPILFCDEPTSGLDTAMAQSVVEVLRSMAKSGKAIVCTIHQPSSQIFELFEKLLFMADGRVVYLGSRLRASSFFRNMGYPCPTNYNPADHYIKLLAQLPGEEKEYKVRMDRIRAAFKQAEAGRELTWLLQMHKNSQSNGNRFERLALQQESPYKATWCQQFRAVLSRCWLATIKEPQLIKWRLFQNILFAVLLGVIFSGQQIRQQNVMNINGAFNMLIANISFENTFNILYLASKEKDIFLRENRNGMYRVVIYFLCKQLAELPIYLLMPLTFVPIYFFIIGLNPEAFWYVLLSALLFTVVVSGFGYMLVWSFDSLGKALAFSTPLSASIMLIGGFYINLKTIPTWLRWFEYLSWYRFSLQIMMTHQWQNIDTIPCDDGLNTTCPFPSGEAVLETFGYDEGSTTEAWIGLILQSIAYRVVAFIGLCTCAYRFSKQ